MATSTSGSANDGLSRLLERQEEEIDNINRKIDLWTKYKSDYQELEKLIDTMQDKVIHPYRVPIAGTQLAFVPGNIIHTNEFTVLLGDNLFALRSGRQATQIIKRRLHSVDEMLKQNKEAKKKTQDWLEIARDHKREKEEFVEIIETM